MSWLFYVLIGQLCLAVAVAIDKVFLNKYIKNGKTFAFLVGCLSVFAFVLLPFGVEFPSSLASFGRNIAVGVTLSISLLLFFLALSRDDATKVAPFMGGVTPVATMILSALFLNEVLSVRGFVCVGTLIFGSVILFLPDKEKKTKKNNWSASLITYSIATLGAVFSATSIVLGRFQFVNDGFVTSFFWQRGGTMLIALILFLQTDVRQDVFAVTKKLINLKGVVFLASKAIGAVGYMLLGFATKLQSATLVNSLQGLQYAFLLVGAVLVGIFNRKLLREHLKGLALRRKLIATTIIAIGLVQASLL